MHLLEKPVLIFVLVLLTFTILLPEALRAAFSFSSGNSKKNSSVNKRGSGMPNPESPLVVIR